MFTTIASSISYPEWASSRYRRLDMLDRWLAGTFYGHLPYNFTEELASGGSYIPLLQRRPSWQANIPQLVARETAFKLWSGKNRPKLNGPDELIESAEKLITEGCLIEKMTEATFCGSVGSVFVSFGITLSVQGAPNVQFDVWHARDCVPTFDDAMELRRVRVQYPTAGRSFLAQGVRAAIGEDGAVEIEPEGAYWFTRDFDRELVVTYLPIVADDYTPGDPEKQKYLQPDLDRTTVHALGWVPGEWIRNLPGGDHPDGLCTFETALNNCIVQDYTLSQLSRGLWYNLCPQVVLIGDLVNEGYDPQGKVIHRGPTNVFHFEGIRKSIDGQQMGGGDAKLLESNGAVFERAKELVELQRKLILEQILASRKDPDKFSGPQSGAAAKVLDEEHEAYIQALRSSYGEKGFLPLLRKALIAAYLAGHPAATNIDPKDLTLSWPQLHSFTPQEWGLLQPAIESALQLGLLQPEEAAQIWHTNFDL